MDQTDIAILVRYMAAWLVNMNNMNNPSDQLLLRMDHDSKLGALGAALCPKMNFILVDKKSLVQIYYNSYWVEFQLLMT